MIRHDAALGLAATALDFDLSTRERAELDAHLAGCPACARTARGLHADAAGIAALGVPALPRRRAEAILADVLAPAGRPVRPARLVLVAALLALLALGSFLVGAELVRRALDDDLAVVPPVPSPSVLVSPQPAPSGSPVASPAPSPDPSGIGLAWGSTTLPDIVPSDVGGAMMSGVIPGGPGAIAWGQNYAAAPPVWTTVDGRSWTRASVETPADWADENPGIIFTIAPGGPGYVAGGFYSRAGTGHRGLIWTSEDGRSWKLLAYDPVFEHAIVDAIVPWRGELLAYGHASIGPSGGATAARMWSSRDGLTWRQEPLSLPQAGLTIYFQAATADRLWAAAGPEGDDVVSQPGVVVGSEDGRTWKLLQLPRYPGVFHAALGGLVALVQPATGETPSPRPSPGVYVSTDATGWEARSLTAGVGNDLVEVGGVSVMIGDDGPARGGCSDDCRPLAWRSADGGRTWKPATVDATHGTMTGAAALPDGTVVAVGYTISTPGRPLPAAWVSTPSPASSPS